MNKKCRITAILACLALSGLQACSGDGQENDKDLCTTGATQCDGNIVKICNDKNVFEVLKTCSDLGDSYVCSTADGTADCRPPKTDVEPDREPCPTGMANSCISDNVLRYCGADGYIAEKTCSDMGDSYVCSTQYGFGKCSKLSSDTNREVCPTGMISSCISDNILRYCDANGYIAEKTCSELGNAYVCTTQNGMGKCSQSSNIEFIRCNDTEICRSDKSCYGVGTCNYTCGEGNTCQWAVCSGSWKCQSGTICDPATLPTGIDDDYDNDGIRNSVELQSKLLDPCLADTDGDTIPDNEEDLNKNGIYEPELGETNPADPSDKTTAEEAAVVRAVCANDAQDSLNVTKLAGFNVAMPGNLGDSEIDESGSWSSYPTSTIARFNDTKGIAFFFASAGSDSIGAQDLFDAVSQNTDDAAPFSGYAQESAASSAVPQQSWIDGGYKTELQTVPNHEIDRHIFSVTIKPYETINDIRDALAGYFLGESLYSLGTADFCQTDENGNASASVWLARSIYKEQDKSAEDKTIAVYSAAVACSEKHAEPAIKTLMTAILSGTHVAPNGLSSSVLGYNARSRSKCQKGNLSAAVAQDETYSIVLQGYPVASTIRVAAVKQGSDTAKELEAGKDWSYDAAKNAVALSCADCEASDTFAISYILWEKITG